MTDQSPVPTPDKDWTDEITTRIEFVVTTVRDKTTVPVTRAADQAIFVVVAGALVVVAVMFLAILLVRMLEVYLPIHPQGRRVWVADTIVAALFLGSGSFLWWLRQARVPLPQRRDRGTPNADTAGRSVAHVSYLLEGLEWRTPILTARLDHRRRGRVTSIAGSKCCRADFEPPPTAGRGHSKLPTETSLAGQAARPRAVVVIERKMEPIWRRSSRMVAMIAITHQANATPHPGSDSCRSCSSASGL